jgi:hypothetical protein
MPVLGATAINWEFRNGRDAGLLLAVLALLGQRCAAGQAPKISSAFVIESDSIQSFPGPQWRASGEAVAGRRYGVRLEFAGAAKDTLDWLRSLHVRVTNYDDVGSHILRSFPSPFFRDPIQEGNRFAAFGDIGILPQGDTVRLSVARGDPIVGDTVLLEITLSVRGPSPFRLGASLGVAVPLNGDTGLGVIQRVGINGRLQFSSIRGLGLPRCHWYTVPVCLVPTARFFAGPFLMEGDFLLSAVAIDTTSPESLAVYDSLQRPTRLLTSFQRGSEGYVRIEFPLVGFGGPLSLRSYFQGGFVTVRGLPDYYQQYFVGFRLGIDAVDVSGRQSFVEIGWGRSDNLQPNRRRRRVTVQLRVPSTEFVFQFVVNNGRLRRGWDNPVIMSIYTPLDLRDIRDIILGKGKGESGGG